MRASDGLRFGDGGFGRDGRFGRLLELLKFFLNRHKLALEKFYLVLHVLLSLTGRDGRQD